MCHFNRCAFAQPRFLVLILVLIMEGAGAKAEEDRSAAELVRQIRASEGEIRDVQLSFVCDIPALKATFYDFRWGYEGGKEFLEGTVNHWPDGQPERAVPSTVKLAFDGEKQRHLRQDPGVPGWTGRVTSLDPGLFRAFPTPNSLLGFDAKPLSRQTFGEILAEAKSVKVRKETELISGRPCYVLEVTEASRSVGQRTQQPGPATDVLVWIDGERGFRPLKIEHYMGFEGKNKWKVLTMRIDNIELAQFDGAWLPIQGDRQFFESRMLPPPPEKAEELAGLSFLEVMERADFEVKPAFDTKRLTVRPESVKINQGIPSEAFGVKFPNGCKIWDDFIQMAYVAGEIPDELPIPDSPQPSESVEVDGPPEVQADALPRSAPSVGASASSPATSGDRTVLETLWPYVLFAVIALVASATLWWRWKRAAV